MTRVGIGYDSHRYAAGRKMRLGGHAIAHTHGLVGHSDGDAVLHAITDAILGAAALGDIGSYFPDDDPQWKGADSTRFVREAVKAVKANGLSVAHADVTIITERPKMAPYIGPMRAATAKALGVPMDHVSIKAKTNEGMGWIGRGEGLAAIAVVALREDGD